MISNSNMEDVIMISPGIVPTVYYQHTCTQCYALLQIKDSVSKFNCPGCNHDEFRSQTPEILVKKYIRNVLPSDSLKDLPKKKSSKKLISPRK